MIVKVAFGTITTDVVYNGNLTAREFIRTAKDAISTVFEIGDAFVEIVPSYGTPNSELGEKLPETNEIMAYYIGNRNVDVFYARLTLLIGNDKYIKTNRDQDIIYFKLSELTNDLDQTQILSENQIRQMPIMRSMTDPEPEPETCGICYERQVCTRRRYSCIHLFCGICPNQWPLSCAICRSS